MNFELSLSQEQKQKISAAQIQSLKLLTMDNFELRQMMQAEYLENPLLEFEGRNVAAPMENGYVTQEDQRREVPNQEHTLQKFIISQLNMRRYSRKEWSVIKFLIENLDDNGFFSADEADMAALCGTTADMVHRLLSDLKKLEPCGIFAKDLRECLLMQLYAKGMPDPLVKVLVAGHLEALGNGQLHSVAKELSLPVAQIRKALREIAKLNPRPLNGLDTSKTDYVVPDIILSYDKHSNRLRASLNDEWYADYRISDYYLQMVSKTEDLQLREYFEKKYLRAKALLEGIEQRRETLLAIGNYIADVQAGFLLGKEKKVPLTMTQTAAELGMAVSTISRAVKGKYVQYPLGCMPFKALFDTPAVKNTDNTLQSREEIMERLKQLIASEDKTSPLSDTALAERLGEMGLPISRRTVAKYRDIMNIKGCFDRRE